MNSFPLHLLKKEFGAIFTPQYGYGGMINIARTIAHERSDEMRSIIIDNNISIKICDNQNQFHVCVKNGKISISWGDIAHLWIRCVAYNRYGEFLRKRLQCQCNEQREVVFSGTEIEIPLAMLDWSLREYMIQIGSQQCSKNIWHPEFPSPKVDPQKGTTEAAESEFLLSALGFILLHEIGHVMCRHTKITYENEYEADMWAIKWMGEKISSSDSTQYQRRLFAVCVAFFWMIDTDTHAKSFGSKSHPPSYLRLEKLVDSFDCEKNLTQRPVVGFIKDALHLILESHFRKTKKPNPVREEYNDPLDMLKHLLQIYKETFGLGFVPPSPIPAGITMARINDKWL